MGATSDSTRNGHMYDVMSVRRHHSFVFIDGEKSFIRTYLCLRILLTARRSVRPFSTRGRKHSPMKTVVLLSLLFALLLVFAHITEGRTLSAKKSKKAGKKNKASKANKGGKKGSKNKGTNKGSSSSSGSSASSRHEAHDSRVIVKYKSTKGASGASIAGTGGKLRQVKTDKGETVGDAIKRLKKDSNVLYVEEDFVVKAVDALPSDPEFPLQWGWDNANTIGAWAANQTGSSAVKVCVIDTGISSSHPDLSRNTASGIGYSNGQTTGSEDDSTCIDIDALRFYPSTIYHLSSATYQL